MLLKDKVALITGGVGPNGQGRGTVRVAIEAALRFGWDRWLGGHGGFVGMTGFGASGPADALYRHFGITPEAVVAEARRLLATRHEAVTA